MDTVRQWKDPRSRSGSTPTHPAGATELTELSDLEMEEVSGAGSGLVGTFGCCWCVPWYSGFTVCGLACDHPGC